MKTTAAKWAKWLEVWILARLKLFHRGQRPHPWRNLRTQPWDVRIYCQELFACLLLDSHWCPPQKGLAAAASLETLGKCVPYHCTIFRAVADLTKESLGLAMGVFKKRNWLGWGGLTFGIGARHDFTEISDDFSISLIFPEVVFTIHKVVNQWMNQVLKWCSRFPSIFVSLFVPSSSIEAFFFSPFTCCRWAFWHVVRSLARSLVNSKATLRQQNWWQGKIFLDIQQKHATHLDTSKEVHVPQLLFAFSWFVGVKILKRPATWPEMPGFGQRHLGESNWGGTFFAPWIPSCEDSAVARKLWRSQSLRVQEPGAQFSGEAW